MKKLTIVVALSGFLIAGTTFAFKIDPAGKLLPGGTPIHENITREALRGIKVFFEDGTGAILRDDFIEALAEENTENDEQGLKFGQLHFDDSRLQESAAFVWNAKLAAVTAFENGNPDVFLPDSQFRLDGNGVQVNLGSAMHTIQDFFAHSTWTEINVYRIQNNIPALPLPRLGITKNPFVEGAFEGVEKLDIEDTNPSAVCQESGLMEPVSSLTSAYYSKLMSVVPLIHSSLDLGFFTDPWNIQTLLGINWPLGRCVHGGDGAEARGINKDKSDRPGYLRARKAAVQATRAFMLDFLARADVLTTIRKQAACSYILQCEEPLPTFTGATTGGGTTNGNVPPPILPVLPTNFSVRDTETQDTFGGVTGKVLIVSSAQNWPARMLSYSYEGTECVAFRPGRPDDESDEGYDKIICPSTKVGPGELRFFQTALPQKVLHTITFALNTAPPTVTDLQPRTVAIGPTYRFHVTGANLPATANLHITFPGCTNIQFLSQSTTLHQFTCAPTIAGTQTVVIRTGPSETPLGTFSVDVSAASTNKSPSAGFTTSTSTTAINTPITFDASSSADPDGTISTYSWDFGDGTANGSGKTVSHSFTTARASAYNVTLTVTDNLGAAATATKPITITATAKPDLVPSAVTLSSPTVAPGATVTVNWTNTNSGNANAATSTTELRLLTASDAINSPSATFVLGVPTGALAIGASVSLNQIMTIPASTAPGSYKIVVVADSGNSIGQGNVANDYASSSVFTVGAANSSILTNPANGHRYEVITCGTWTQCDAAARAKGGNLVTIRSAEENAWIVSNIFPVSNGEAGIWMGATDEGTEGIWRWSSGEAFLYSNWNIGEPNNFLGAENSGLLNKFASALGTWNDGVATAPSVTQAIIEYSDAFLFDTFDRAAIDLTKWIVGPTCCGFSGTATVGASALTLGATANIDTRGKVTVSGDNTIVIEARMVGPGANRDTTIALVDVVSGAAIGSAAQSIEFGDTNYSNWGFHMYGYGAYNFVEVERPSGVGPAPQNATVLGSSTNAYMEYRLTITGTQVKMERGPTLANITQTATRTLGQTIAGKSFYIRLNTGGGFSPAIYDWVRVNVAPAHSGTFSVAANNPTGTLFIVPDQASSCAFNASGSWSGGGGGFVDGAGFASLGAASTVSPSLSFYLPSAPVSSLIVSKPVNGYVLSGLASNILTVPGTSLYFKINDSIGNFGDNSGALLVAYQCQ
jgi:PKD domain/Lectin C-type domain/CARDB